MILAAACGGEPFTSAGSAGSGSGGDDSGGGKGSGGANAGAAGKAGSSSGRGGASSSGGAVGAAGSLNVAGVLGISGSTPGGAGSSGTQPCVVASDCPRSSQCVQAFCTDGECSEENLPDGPFMLQVPGDCKQARCESGKEVLVVDATDSDDKVECTTDACNQNGMATHTARVGAECGAGGLCSPEGKCEMCDRNQCPAADACHLPYCSANQCKLAPRPAGTICGSDAATDARQCDEQGSCVDCFDNGGCDEASACTAQHTCAPA
jgi:hypothetical protein